MRDFHNTAQESGERLERYKRRARSQQELIVDFMRSRPCAPFTPYDILEHMEVRGVQMLITSVRRAMTNATEAGLITKTELQADGPHGVKNTFWSFIPKRHQQLDLFLKGERD
jgi:Fe2+ or Zn2+ uptake regulation protein